MTINPNNIFELFSSEFENLEGENEKVHIDFTQTPIYWIGMFKKQVLNSINFNKKALKFFKEAQHELDLEDIKEAGESIVYNRAWDYINNIDLENPTHLEAIEQYSDEYLDTALKLGINYFEQESIQEYEKCAHLQKILNKTKEFLS